MTRWVHKTRTLLLSADPARLCLEQTGALLETGRVFPNGPSA